MLSIRKAVALAALSASLAHDAWAYRPFATEDAGVAARGRFELETSWDHLDWPDGHKDEVFLMVNTYGAAERLEVAVETPYVFHDAPAAGGAGNGFGDVTLTSKLRLAPERGARPAATLKGFVKLAHASVRQDLGTGAAHYALAAAATKTLGPLILHGTLGYALVEPRSPDRVRGVHLFGAAADWEFSKRVSLATEINGNRRVEKDGLADPLSGYLGLIVRPTRSESVFLDAGVRRGLSATAPRWQGVLGLFTAF